MTALIIDKQLDKQLDQTLQAKYIDYIMKGRENATITCHKCKNEIFKQQTLVITSQGKFLHPYCYFHPQALSQETYNQLKGISEDITDPENIIDFLINSYWHYQELSNSPKILPKKSSQKED